MFTNRSLKDKPVHVRYPSLELVTSHDTGLVKRQDINHESKLVGWKKEPVNLTISGGKLNLQLPHQLQIFEFKGTR